MKSRTFSVRTLPGYSCLTAAMLIITSSYSGGSMLENNYSNTGYLIVDPEDSKVSYWGNSDYIVIQDSNGSLVKYHVRLNNGIDSAFNVPSKANEGFDNWVKVTNPDSTGLSILNSDTADGFEPSSYSGLQMRPSKRKIFREKGGADTVITKSRKNRKKLITRERLTPTEKVIPE